MSLDAKDRLTITAFSTCPCEKPDCGLKEGYLRLEGIGLTKQGVGPFRLLLPLDCARAVRDTITESLAAIADACKENA